MPRRDSLTVRFPDPRKADPSGLLAYGGDLDPETLLTAYSRGIFPWYSEGEPILWWSPDPRFVLDFAGFHAPKSLLRTIRRGTYEIRADTAFEKVVERCGARPRPAQNGTWITEAMRSAYVALHGLGYAHSIEAYHEGRLAGGLYGVSLGGVFFGESMFADRPDASKAALHTLVKTLEAWEFDFIDCQLRTENLERFGAKEISRAAFLRRLGASLKKPTRRGKWDTSSIAHESAQP